MLFRPNGKANSVRLNNFMPGSITTNQWFTIKIPLSYFEEITDLTKVKNLEFPYSAGANHYDWDIYSIIFTGGINPVIWLGPGNINNAHNGNGGPGEVHAEWSINSSSEPDTPTLKLYANAILIDSIEGLSSDFTIQAESPGLMNIVAEAWSGTNMIASSSMQVNIEELTTPDIGISILSPQENMQFEHQELINILTETNGNLSTDLPYLQVTGIPDGWRKLKIGNNNLYRSVNVINSGNTNLEMILRDNNSVNWSKIELRPNGISANPIGIEAYFNQKQELDNGWYKISIPISAFDASIDFAALKNIEFPYSKSAGNFELQIQEIKFTGGTEEYFWFGGEKIDNIHDGFGNPGQLLAELVQPDNGGYDLVRADLFVDQTLYSSDFSIPFSFTLPGLSSGAHNIEVVLNLDVVQIQSNKINFTVLEPVFDIPEIELDPFYPFGVILSGKSFPISGQITNLEASEIITTVLEIDGNIVSSTEESNFNFLVEASTLGSHQWSVKVNTASGAESISGPYDIEFIDVSSASNLGIVSPTIGENIVQNTNYFIQANFTPEDNGNQPYMEISNPGSGYRKLKIGNNSNSLYSPKADLIADGNTELVLVLNLLDGEPDLSKITICPQEVTTAAPKLSDYWSQAEEVGEGWKKVTIPLSDFDSSIDFSSLGYLAFPYSRDAGYFKIGLRSIEFTGGSSPYQYFNETKLDNIHDGFGNPGQLLVSIITADQAPEPEQYAFFLDDLFVGYVDDMETTVDQLAQEIGTHSIEILGIMNNDLHLKGQGSTFNIIEAIPESQSIVLKLTFNQAENIAVQKAKLRYNKEFAYSLTLDDGLDDAYTNAFKVLNGGYVDGNGQTYPGLFTTDGCGNDVPFTGGLAWFSVSKNYNDLHINTPGYMKWNELIEMYNAGWDVLNHSYSHSADATTDHYFQIDENQKIIFENTGIEMTQFVIPGGAVYLPYIPAAQNYGMNAIYAYKSDFVGYPLGIQVDNSRTWEDMTIYRGYNFDDSYNTTNITQKIDQIAGALSPDTHIWYNDFTHRVLFGEKGGSLQFETFAFYMQHLADQYGKLGQDNLWMAPLQQVWEYLYVRDHTTMITEWNGTDYNH